MEQSYWRNLSQQRLGRRRFVAGLGASAAGASLLAACGGSSTKTAKGPTSNLVTAIADETKDVKRGGTYKIRSSQDPPAFEAQNFVNSTATSNYCYSTLVLIKDGHMERWAGEIGGDVAESWEFSPDRTQLTMKINPNAHWTPQAPTNGRAVDARDVQASWQRMKTISTRRGEFANEVDANAPIISMTATDDRTLSIKLKEPTATILSLLATAAPGTLLLGPKEMQDTSVLDLRTTVRGSGPWYLADIQSGSSFTFKRNPGYHQDKREIPYLDQVDWPIVTDYAAAIAQFRTGAIYSLVPPGDAPGIRNEDILPLKREVTDLDMLPTDMQSPSFRNLFGVQPSSPFKDERVRQAWVLTWDRDLFLDTYYNVAEYKKEGLPAETAYEGALPAASWNGWFLDPRSNEFGPNSKYFKYDLAEAKKLMDAAGYAGGVQTDINLPANGPDVPNAPGFFRIVDIVMAMVQNSGLFKLNRRDWRFQAEFQPRFRDARGKFDGAAINLAGIPAPDPVTNLTQFYHPGGGLTQGTDSTMEDLLNRANREFDTKKRQELVKEFQRYDGARQFFPRIAAASGFDLTWPVVRNKGVWQADTFQHRGLNTTFLDPSKAPLKRA